MIHPAALAATALLLAGCETTNMASRLTNLTAIQQGGGTNNTTTGAAGGDASTETSTQLEKCDSPLGTLALVENLNAGWYTILRDEYRLPPTANLLRLMVQQSNCFLVVERSAAGMRAIERERNIMSSGEMRQGSNFGQGQMVASDYALSPEVVFSNSNAGGMAGIVGALAGAANPHLARLSGGLQSKEATAMLTLVDNRSGVQVAASEGSASKTDLNLFGGLFGGRAGAGLGGYTNTPQGKVITAAFMDAFNQMVRSLRNYRAQSVQGQGLGGGGRLGVDGGTAPSQTYTPENAPKSTAPKSAPARRR